MQVIINLVSRNSFSKKKTLKLTDILLKSLWVPPSRFIKFHVIFSHLYEFQCITKRCSSVMVKYNLQGILYVV